VNAMLAPSGEATLCPDRPPPNGWQWVRLEEACEAQTGTRDPRVEPAKEFRYVDITSVDNNRKRILKAKTLVGKDAPSQGRQVIRSGDVIVSTTRPNLNAVALVPPDLDGEICSTGFCVLRAKPGLDQIYLFLFVQTPEFVQRLSELVKGALYPAVTDKQVRAQWIPLPRLSDQQRIAATLSERLATVDRARAAAETRLEAAKAIPAAYLRLVLNGTKARGWPTARLGVILRETRNGIYKPDSFYGTGTPILKMFNIGRLDGTWWLERVDRIRLTEEERRAYTLVPGDILLNRVNSRELVGKCAVIDRGTADAVFESKNMRLRVNTEIALPAYVATCLNGAEGRRQIQDRLKQIVGQATINRADLDSLDLLLPPVIEQQRITALLTERLATVEQVRRAAEQELGAIESLTAALLRRVFSGEID